MLMIVIYFLQLSTDQVTWTFPESFRFCGHLNCSYMLINYFLLTYEVGINYALIINRINYFLENILCSKNDKIVADIL